MRVMIVGSLAAELGRAAAMAASRGAAIAQADDPRSALDGLRRDAGFELVLCDVKHDIAWLVQRLAAERIQVAVVACGLPLDHEAAVKAIRAGAREFLPLPPDPDLIAAMLEAAAGQPHVAIARDAVMLKLLHRAEQIAKSDASVFISGESGTGKEVIARHIHRKSRRADGPFIALNCAAIPDSLLESELFGHEKGAFSGALARRIGKFEAASGGTLLLDEVSEMDFRLQAKLLRALQEREIDRLGGASPVKVNVRILATSNRDIQAEIAAGRFRADLFFRLNVVALALPPLRQRVTDIAALAAHYARHYAGVNGLPVRPLSAGAVAVLEAYDWPGNVRELENVIHRAVLLADQDEVEVNAIELDGRRDAPGTMVSEPAQSPAGAALPSGKADPGAIASLVGRSMDQVERALIIETLNHTLGNRTHAATILGISIRALRNKLRDYARDGSDIRAPLAGIAA